MINREDFKKILKAKPNCILGKNGVTPEFLYHAEILLKKKKLIKIRVLKAAISDFSIKQLALNISKQIEAQVVDIRGKTIIISK